MGMSGRISESFAVTGKDMFLFQFMAGVYAGSGFTDVRGHSPDTYQTVFFREPGKHDVSDYGLPLFATMSDPLLSRCYRGDSGQFFPPPEKITPIYQTHVGDVNVKIGR
jgi:hypothetical protein